MICLTTYTNNTMRTITPIDATTPMIVSSVVNCRMAASIIVRFGYVCLIVTQKIPAAAS